MSDSFQTRRTAVNLRDALAADFLTSEFREGGTWSPIVSGSTTPGVTTHSIQSGQWVRHGNLLVWRGRVDWTAATGTGNLQISIPSTLANVSSGHVAMSLYTINLTFANGSVQGLVAPNTNFMTMLSPATNAAGTVIAMEAAATVIFAGFGFLTA